MISRVAPVLNARKAGFVEHRYEPVTFALRDAVKDVRMATELYKRVGAQAPITSKVKDLYERAAKTVGDQDMSAIATVYVGEPAARS